MRIKVLIGAICIMIFALIQSTLLDYVTIFNVKPNLLVVFIIITALIRGNIEGAVAGFFSGLMQDIMSGKVLGFYSLLGLYLGLTLGSLNKRLYRENILVAVFFTFVSSMVYELAVYFFGIFIRHQSDFIYAFKSIIVPEAIYNCIISIILYIIVIKFNDKFEDMNKASRKY